MTSPRDRKREHAVFVFTSSVKSPFEALRTATTPLVGRDEKMEVLMRRWAKAKVGDVLISGEPGIDGKMLLCISSMVS